MEPKIVRKTEEKYNLVIIRLFSHLSHIRVFYKMFHSHSIYHAIQPTNYTLFMVSVASNFLPSTEHHRILFSQNEKLSALLQFDIYFFESLCVCVSLLNNQFFRSFNARPARKKKNVFSVLSEVETEDPKPNCTEHATTIM